MRTGLPTALKLGGNMENSWMPEVAVPGETLVNARGDGGRELP
jgi:hypothetical protein